MAQERRKQQPSHRCHAGRSGGGSADQSLLNPDAHALPGSPIRTAVSYITHPLCPFPPYTPGPPQSYLRYWPDNSLSCDCD
ncbi:hypothetical protein B0H17DRAFT_711940 [Mycena rosella]|uniref:Uncharacterized protein n=1 Tax=Mycena rosella TaxID=1033263 RepID=A0AAD7D9T8_MYCRO|nr:hypothetical protein B0H17DRAFT_711940 [Mycena rosella]